MKWAGSLIKISRHEVETLQKRLAAVVARRTDAELRLAVLEAEGEAETMRARQDAMAGWYHAGFQQGLRARKAQAQGLIDELTAEEAGARDALAQAFEAMKKYELVAENDRVARRKETARRETADLDELGLRQAMRR